MSATGERHWHVEFSFPIFVTYTRHDEEGEVTLEIGTVLGIIPYIVRKHI